ncbi:MAG: hypothetical protein EPN20_10370 [Magnetospirillum sp.]|nr:MAG: hypothetical protein EPN20_10370 [Magnetospirillum sp.]
MQTLFSRFPTLLRQPDGVGEGGDSEDDSESGGGGGHYNPDQPRDWHGRWTNGPDQRGGGSSAETQPDNTISYSFGFNTGKTNLLEAAMATQSPTADPWQAESMAAAVLGRGDFSGVTQHYLTQAQTDPAGTKAEIQAVTMKMAKTDAARADAFHQHMNRALPQVFGAQGPFNPHPSVTLEFDGKAVRAMDQGKVIRSWAAVSGNSGFQAPEFQGLKFKGPLPEGDWQLRQDRYQHIDLRGTIAGIFPKDSGISGRWPGSIPAWGTERVWLDPAPGTDAKGRDNFSVHGGWVPGSAGCIDMTGQMGDFADWFRSLGKDVRLTVRYNR